MWLNPTAHKAIFCKSRQVYNGKESQIISDSIQCILLGIIIPWHSIQWIFNHHQLHWIIVTNGDNAKLYFYLLKVQLCCCLVCIQDDGSSQTGTHCQSLVRWRIAISVQRCIWCGQSCSECVKNVLTFFICSTCVMYISFTWCSIDFGIPLI